MDAKLPDYFDLISLARERVQIGPPPEWITSVAYDSQIPASTQTALTHLLIEQQVQAELGRTFVRTAIRLNTMQAVQHQSQWRLGFEPQTQRLVIHSVKVMRGSTETEHANLAKIRFLQREAGLEGCVIDGYITLLLLLEDVCPGDILEWAYTLSNSPRLLPDKVSCFFTLPPGVEIGNYYFSVTHSAQRKLRWASSDPQLSPAIRTEIDEVCCYWTGQKTVTPEIEDCTPSWHIVMPWVHVSDCSDWQTVARAIAAGWIEEPPGEAMRGLLDEISSAESDLASRVSRAIEIVQEKFRYLSVDLEFGGQIPAPRETVIRRRFGDCKDLAFLLAGLLRALGVSARPVLVNTHWSKSISLMLPSPGVFNHVVVEFELDGKRRWVDTTIKAQGGDALSRLVPDFGLGLAVDADTLTLIPVPAASLPTNSYEVKESFLLDTAGNSSLLAVEVIAKGTDAEGIRFNLAHMGYDAFARQRLKHYADRFSRAKRIGELQVRDNRERNEFALAEVFEIDEFLRPNIANAIATFAIQSDITGGMLMCPAPDRRNPLALPYPCNRIHIVELEFAALGDLSIPPHQGGNEFFTFVRRCKILNNYLRLTFSLDILADHVPPDRLHAHAERVRQTWAESGIHLHLPLGYRRSRTPRNFGELPAPSRSAPLKAKEQPAVAPRPERIPKAPASNISGDSQEKSLAGNAVRPPVSATPLAVRTRQNEPGIHGARLRRSRSNGPAKGRAMNTRCLHSLYVFLGSVAAFVLGNALAPMPKGDLIAGLLFIFIMAALPCSLFLAVSGWRQCVKHPERYSGGSTVAILTLGLGAAFALIITPAFIQGVRFATANAKARNQAREDGFALLRFDALNFRFRSPGSSWQQTDARMFGTGPVLAFARSEPMFFTLVANPLGVMFGETQSDIVEFSKAQVRNEATSYRLLSEREAMRNGASGWQTETHASFQGRDFFLVHWLIAVNGFGYQLAVWGPAELEVEVRAEAERLFTCFETHTSAGQ